MKRIPNSLLILLAITQLWVYRASGQSAGQLQNLHSKQLLVVLTNGWNDLQGKLYAFKKMHGKWVLQFRNPVVLGRGGLGIGDGLIPLTIAGAPVKHEGDKKSPAGIFSIGKAFGYADRQHARWIKNPYIQAFDTLICVDDQYSANYNRLVSKDTAKTDYKSFEYMHRRDNYYKWGLFINHNTGNVVLGDGSCIFLHIWENSHTGTVGCTAMKEKYVLRILHWINAKDMPLLLQLPAAAYRKLRTQFPLPLIIQN